MKSISSRTRQLGIVLALLLSPIVARLVWEMTYLTWREGEQMIGFTMMHVFPLFFLVGYDPRGKTAADMAIFFPPSDDVERRRSREEAYRLLNNRSNK